MVPTYSPVSSNKSLSRNSVNPTDHDSRIQIKVTASASTGIATDLGCVPETEDTITLLVDWEKKGSSRRRATGVYTASWTAPQKAGVHSNQYFHYMASKGEVRVNQAKRGYDVTEDESGLTWYNPFVSPSINVHGGLVF